MTHSKLEDAFDIDTFREEGHRLINLLSDHLKETSTGNKEVTQPVEPAEELQFWKDYKFKSTEGFLSDIVERSINLHHPKYMGHQVAVPVPETALAGLVSDLLNNGMGIYEMGAAASAIEKWITDEMCAKLGYDGGDGFLTSGGTLANLTALLAARSAQNLSNSSNLVILVSEQAHYCIERAAVTMGLGHDAVIKVKTNPDFTLSTDDLLHQYQNVINDGKKVLCLVACACSTATGTYDNITDLVQFKEQHNIWLHVDGAHGGAAAFSDKYQPLMAGVSASDSIVIDLHKMMLTPALATAVLFKSSENSYKSFHQDASYLFEKQDPEWFNLAKRTYETTKFMMSIKFFLLVKKYGWQIIDDFVTRQYDLTKSFAALIQAHDQFELAHEPMSNILCFRYRRQDLSETELNRLNKDIRQKMIDHGEFYIVQAVINQRHYLRTTLMSPFTEEKHLKDFLSRVEDLAELPKNS